MAKTKAPTIALSLRQKIGRYKSKNEKASYGELAEKFNVSYNQARSACIAWKEGLLKRSSPKSNIKAVEAEKELPADELLEKQYHHAVAQLQANDKLPADERIAMLDKLFSMRKKLQQVKLESHLKKVDSEVFTAVIRRFEPHATDEDVIAIYRQIAEELRLEGI